MRSYHNFFRVILMMNQFMFESFHSISRRRLRCTGFYFRFMNSFVVRTHLHLVYNHHRHHHQWQHCRQRTRRTDRHRQFAIESGNFIIAALKRVNNERTRVAHSFCVRPLDACVVVTSFHVYILCSLSIIHLRTKLIRSGTHLMLI